jgi:hypothetical protein
MTATGRLFWIETRRSIGLLAFPVLAGLAWLAWYLNQRSAETHQGITVWPQTSIDIAFAVALVGPAAGGLAAWVAGRDRRRGLGDLLATTPAPVTRRELTLLTATTIWALLAFVAAGIYQGIVTAREATWGGPVWPPIFIAGLAITAQAAIGYAAGSFAGSPLTSRLMAGLVPILLFGAQVWPTTIRGGDVMLGPTMGTSNYPYENLSPVTVIQDIGGSVYWSPRMDLFWAAAAWFAGLGAFALAIMVLRRRRRSPVAWGTVVAAVLALVVGWTQLVPAQVYAVPPPSRAIAYEPVCTHRSIEICVHPAYESVLDDTADIVDAVVRPLAGLPGFPVRAEQVRPDREGEAIFGPQALGPVAPGLLGIVPAVPETADVTEASYVAVAAVTGQTDWFVEFPTAAQSAIAIWLMRQAGWDLDLDDLTWKGGNEDIEASPVFVPPPDDLFIEEPTTREGADAIVERSMGEIMNASERFGALSPEVQHAWLEANFAALRAGELTLEDLP